MTTETRIVADRRFGIAIARTADLSESGNEQVSDGIGVGTVRPHSGVMPVPTAEKRAVVGVIGRTIIASMILITSGDSSVRKRSSRSAVGVSPSVG